MPLVLQSREGVQWPTGHIPMNPRRYSSEEHKKLAVQHAGKERCGWREVACGQWEGRARTVQDSFSEAHSSEDCGSHGCTVADVRRPTGLPDDLDWIDEALTDAYEATAGPETAQVHPYEFTTSILALACEMAGERLEVIEGAKVVPIERGTTTAQSRSSPTKSDKNKEDRVVGVTYVPTTGPHTVHIPADSVLLASSRTVVAYASAIPAYHFHSCTFNSHRANQAALSTRVVHSNSQP